MEEASSGLNFVIDLAVILISAGVFTLISKALKQPLILGYILAGFLVGPKFILFPTVTSVESVEQWSEIGMIFLMFALGLEFSFKGLIKVGSSAIITAGFKFVGMFVLGMMVGSAIGWTMMESVFLGGLLSMASTTIVIKAYDELGLKHKSYAPLVFGTLVVEDLIAILLMVLLSTMAVSNQFAGTEMLFNLGKLAFFLILWFLVGIFVIPTLLNKAKRFLNDEILLIVGIGLCFGMVSLANYVGFSSALGAFVMGSILAETTQGEQISKLVVNIKNLFGAIFFVSVGMMIDPVVIVEHWGVILLLTVVVIVGHFIFAAGGVILIGKGLDNAVNVGLSLAQLGEFAFIIASLGTTLGVMRGFIYPVIIAVTVITTFTTPYVIKMAGPLTRFLYAKLPPSAIARINPKQVADHVSTNAETQAWKTFIKAYIQRIVLYGVVVVAILLGAHKFLKPFMVDALSSWAPIWVSSLFVVITIAAILPFLFGMTANSAVISKSVKFLIKHKHSNNWLILSMMLIRIFIAMSPIIAVIVANFDLSYWTILLVIVCGGGFFMTARGSMHRFGAIEKHFLSNLNEKEVEERRNAPVRTMVQEKFAGYDVHIETVIMSPDSEYVGKMIKDTPLRKVTGVNIVKIKRGSKSILAPNGKEHLYPYDRVVAVGTSEQLEAFASMMAENSAADVAEDKHFAVEPMLVRSDSIFCNSTLASLDLRAHGCMVISVIRNGQLFTNPNSDFVFDEDDTVWIAGAQEEIKAFVE